jgi:hypothetical protein
MDKVSSHHKKKRTPTNFHQTEGLEARLILEESTLNLSLQALIMDLITTLKR